MSFQVTTIEYDSETGPGSADELAFEETVFAAMGPVKGEVESKRQTKSTLPLVVVVLIVSFVLLGRLGFLQLHKGAQFRAMAEGNRLRERIVLAPRGQIVDRNGAILATSSPSFRLVLTPLDIPKENVANEVTAACKLLGLDVSALLDIASKIDPKSVQGVLLATNLKVEQAVLFQTHALEFPGLDIQAVPVRQYTSAESFAHVLGTTGTISESDPAFGNQGYSAQDVVGKSGLEQSYESSLKGINGQNLVEVDASGNVVKSLGEVASSPGSTVRVSLDKDLQEQIYQAFVSRGNVKGAAVALNPKTGEVLALVSFPGFNTNAFAQGISETEYRKVLQDPTLPLFNRAIGAQLPPGSTAKLMVAVAGLEEGVINDRTVIVDSGKISIPNQFNPSVVYDYVGWKRAGLGPMTVRSAIALSSDIFFYEVGGGLPGTQQKGLGIERLASYYRKFNLGKPTGIDIPGEKSGLVPDPAWKSAYFKESAVLGKWYLGDTYHVSIGQGDMLVTPLQMALWTATIANNGVGLKPHIVLSIIGKEGKAEHDIKPEVIVPKVASDTSISVVQQGMRQTVLAGSAQQLKALPISSAGKTGTAQFDNNTKEHAWFTSYAPYEDPQIVLTVLVEGGGEGHAVAEPIAKEALMWWANHRYQK